MSEIEKKDLLIRHIEKRKSTYTYFRFMVTVSTTSMLVTVGFLEKLFTNPEWKILATISIISFLVSVISSVFAYTSHLGDFPGEDGNIDKPSAGVLVIIIGWASFMCGITSLAIFCLINMT